MPRRPAETEQRGFQRGTGSEYPLLVQRMRIGFMREQEARAGHHSCRAGRQRGARIGGGGHAACQQHRPAAGDGQHPGKQCQAGLASQQVTTGLDTLRNQAVDAPRQGSRGFLHGADLGQDEGTYVLQRGDQRRGSAEKQDGHVNACGQAGGNVPFAHERHQQVDGDCALRGLRADTGNAGPQALRRRQPERAQPTSRRHRTGQARAGHAAAHAGLQYRHFQTQAVD